MLLNLFYYDINYINMGLIVYMLQRSVFLFFQDENAINCIVGIVFYVAGVFISSLV